MNSATPITWATCSAPAAARTPDLTKTRVTTDYASPEMVIRRYIVVPGGVERIAAQPQGELLSHSRRQSCGSMETRIRGWRRARCCG